MTSMNANEIIPSCAMENGTLVPAAITPVAAAEPAPTNTRNAVPRTSAASFCGVVGGAAMRVALGRPSGRGRLTSLRRDGILLETCSTSSNGVSRNVKPGPGLRQEGTSDLPGQISAVPPGWPAARAWDWGLGGDWGGAAEGSVTVRKPAGGGLP